jgi:hypothetical protein
MNFFRSMEIDPTCKFSPPQSRSGGISFYGFSAPRRFDATKVISRREVRQPTCPAMCQRATCAQSTRAQIRGRLSYTCTKSNRPRIDR